MCCPIVPRKKYLPLQASPNRILLLGGIQDNRALKSCLEFDVGACTLNSSKVVLPTAKYNFGAVRKNDELFLFGGHNGQEILKSCEIVNTRSNNSLIFSFMRLARENLAATIASDEKVYITGGYGGPGVTYLSNAERFDFGEGVWEVLPSM